MALQWEPQWEEVEVEYHGIRLRVKRDRVTGLYLCPICGHGERATYLFSIEDLVYHIYSHAGRLEKHAITVASPREAEEEEEEDED